MNRETPTPDPPAAGSPLGSTLTAEEIAALREQYGPENGLVHYEPQIIRLIASHTALHDRLARAEKRVETLQAVCDEIFGAILRSDWKGRDARKAVLLLEATLRPAPTDGAARDGER